MLILGIFIINFAYYGLGHNVYHINVNFDSFYYKDLKTEALNK